MKIRTSLDHLSAYKIYLRVEEALHDFFKKNNYLKIDLPVLSPELIPESYLEVFETMLIFQKHNERLYLTPSPELFLKRLLAYGVGDCYYLGKSFRNADPSSTLHSPEFTMLELYKMHASYMDIADVVLRLLRHINQTLHESDILVYQGKKIDLSRWEKISVAGAFKTYADINSDDLFNHKRFQKRAREKGYIVNKSSYEDLWSQIYVQEIEPYLGKNGFPTLIYDYPKEFAALAQLNPDGKTAQRFEFYIEGVELGDCYSELTDPEEQRERFETEHAARQKYGKITHPIDYGFIKALEHGLGVCAGIAIGFERLAMIFADTTSIDTLKLVTIS